jgi:tRNA G18 (ribose-2'-O)-methylase SpoU
VLFLGVSCEARWHGVAPTVGPVSSHAPDERDDNAAYAVGLGPWVGPPPVGDQWDPDLLREGDRRNVEDRYRYWRHEAIVADLDRSRFPLHIAIENWEHDFNIGSIVRTANAFNVAAFHIVGKRRWNRRGAMVTDRYQHEIHHPTVGDLTAWAAQWRPTVTAEVDGQAAHGIPLIGIDNVPGSFPIEGRVLPSVCVLVFGQEGPGLSEEMREACEVIMHITQYGSTRSVNAGAAAAIAMHTWIEQHGPQP